MIRRLGIDDHESLMQYLGEEPSINLFMIGDIEAFGYESDFQDIWGQMDTEGNYEAVMLRYFQSYIVYAKASFDVQGFAAIMNEDPNFKEFSGKASVVGAFENGIVPKLGERKPTYFSELKVESFTPISTSEDRVKEADLEDIDRIIEIRTKGFSSYNTRSNARESLLKVMESGTSRSFYTEDQGVMTSIASTTAENSMSAMIVAVCTDANYRQQGLASEVMSTLCRRVLNEGKTLCLFYDNPKAGAIYKRLGFQDIGMWNMYR
ncbi:GNAT family N-acetyltransferase [Paenibacillus sp. N1-5-1-14]|uniref:GNAT family N-acetyltransferase n=1 Tax=Paenibacillus radicibacter TaxID=2972488 RepID=UPI0021596ACB|nr:GNAT family N-acetyltransferase [Paenibacillus radicibacter]MCR8641286.1 GNAT family N-acetyltransferase [Paenibacillus radicibacter]